MKNVKNKLLRIASIATLALTITSCTDDFYDVNQNPNDPPVSTPKLSLSSAEQDIANLNATYMNVLGQYMMYNWAVPSNWNAFQDYIRYNITSDFNTRIFEWSYSRAFKNFVYIDHYEDPNGVIDYTIYRAISTIMKAYQYQSLVDIYGDIPYTEANMREKNTTPKYDKAEDIYKDLIKNLTDVVVTLDNIPANAENPKGQDIIFGGNIAKWQKFANTIKLRLLVRLSNTNQDAFIKSEIQKIQANGKGFITEDVMANPGYADVKDKLNPFYGYFREASTGNKTDAGDFMVASDYALDFFFNNNDDRVGRIYSESVAGGYKGVEQSTVLPGSGFTSKDLSHIGPGLIKSPDQDQPIMLLSEALFIQSEAVVRNYMSGNAETLYNKAIEESFRFLGVEDYANKASVYYNQGTPNVTFSATANKIQAIMTQKWAALNGTSALESWIDYNRTGFPAGLPIPVESNRNQRPYRLLYPASEISRNSKNVPKQTKEDAFTKKIFYQK